MKRVALLFAVPLLLLAGCKQTVEIAVVDAGAPDATSCEVQCSDVCCAADERCDADGRCCKPTCAGKSCGDDGCGGSCGSCEQGWTCSATGSCECDDAETDADFCARLGFACGTARGKDHCGRDREVACSGTCDPGYACNPETGKCECQAESDEAFCTRLAVVCGTAAGKDACGNARSIQCDRCGANRRCDAATSSCVCTETDAQLCQRLGKDCDSLTADDLCGQPRTVDCGSCPAGELCSATNTCQVCTPLDDTAFCAAQGKQCGPFTAQDPCSQQSRTPDCGGCVPGFDCDATANQCVTCPSESPQAFCQRLGNKECDALTGIDNCRLVRTENCGTCQQGFHCDTNQHCVCTPETNADFCARMATQCGPAAGTDNCGAPRSVAECGPCGTGEVCLVDRCITCTQETNAQFCDRLGLYCDAANGVDNCGIPRAVVNCGSCPSPQTCQPNGACGSASLASNDTCAQPELLQFSGTTVKTASAHGDTSLANDDIASSCVVAPTGKDVVYKFVIPPGPTQTLHVSVAPSAGSSLVPNPSLRIQQCAQPTSEIACASVTASTPTAALAARNLAPGAYFLWVDGQAPGADGPFDLVVTLTDSPPVPSNDTCASPTPLTALTGPGTNATVTGDLTSAANDYTGTCATMSGGDLVYSFSLASAARVTATVTGDPTMEALQPAVHLRSDCASSAPADEIACAAVQSNGTGAAATATAAYLDAATYYVIVDSLNGWGAFSLTLTAEPPVPGDVCANAEPLLIDPVSGVGFVNGDTTAALDDTASICQPLSTGGDLVYSFTVSSASGASARVEVVPNTSGYFPLVSLRADCATKASELACVKSTASWTTTLTRSNLPAGTYYVWVDGSGGTPSGAFTLTVTLGAPISQPPNDLCGHATPIALDAAGVATVPGSTAGALDDYQGGCATSSTPHAGADLVYAVTLGSTQNLAVTVSRSATTPTFRPAVYVRSSCGDATTEVACANEANGTAFATANNLAPGTYYIIVDGVVGTEGDFTLGVATYGPLTNDGCSNPMALTFDANGDAFAASNLAAAQEDSNSNTHGLCGGPVGAGDLVYSFTLAQPMDVSITETPVGTTLVPVLYVRATSCNSQSVVDELSCATPYPGTGPATVRLKRLDPGTYWIWADSYWGRSGPFSLQVHQASPPALASNDLCGPNGASAIALVPDATNTVRVTGDLDTATGNYDGTCKTTGSGPDLVYSFFLGMAQSVSFTVTPTGGATLKPGVYLQSVCGGTGATELGCGFSASAGATVSVSRPVLPAGTYFVIVDSYSRNDTGTFTLTGTFGPPASSLANDQCTGATPLTWTGTPPTATVTDDTSNAFNDEKSFCSRGTTVLNGPDLVYSFALSSAALVTATVTRGSGNTTYKPAVSIRSSCAPRDEVGCGVDLATPDLGTATVAASLPAGTYYVFVDGLGTASFGTGFGPFTLTLTQGAAAISADGCGMPGSITLDPITGSATVSGNLATATNSGDSGCRTGTGSDMVYQLVLPTDKAVTVTLAPATGSSPALYPNVYLRRTCADPASEMGCSSVTSGNATLSFARVPAGTYYVWADTYSSSYNGQFNLTVATSPVAQPPPSNDDCSAPQVLVLDPANGGTQVVGDTTYAQQDYAGNCAPSLYPFNGPDLVYRFTLAQDATVYASVARDPTAPTSFYPSLYLRSTCADATTEIACTATTAAGAASIVQRLPAGTYYLFVDGQLGGSGKFVLNLDARTSSTAPMTNDTCATAQPLSFDANGVAIAAGSTAGMNKNSSGSCSGTATNPPPDVVYSFTLTGSSRVTVDLNPAASNFFPMLFVQATCGNPSTERGCSSISSYSGAELNLGAVPAGTYYVFVSSAPLATSAPGPFVLSVRTSPAAPPPVNDSCLNATQIPLSGGTGSATGDTTNATNDYVSYCSSGTNLLNGPDVVYSFTLTAAASVTARVTRDTSNHTYQPAVSIRTSCDPADELACARDLSTGATSVTATLAAGTYYVFVDGVSATANSSFGPFTLTLTTAAAIAGDSCGSAIPLTLDSYGNVTVSGDLLAVDATPSGDGLCVSGTSNDLVYSLTLRGPKTVKATLTPAAPGSLAPVVYLRRACADATTELACAYNSASPTASAATWTLNRVEGGTYYLWVDAYSSSRTGGFSLTVQTSDPLTPPPLNDSCGNAQAIVLDATTTTNNSAHFSGDLSWAADDFTASCQTATYPLTGGDVVYSVTLSQTAWVYAMLSRDPQGPTWSPGISVRTQCADPTTEQGCQMTNGSAYASLVRQLPAGTYYFIIDSQRGFGGPFDFDVVARPVNTSSNDTCANAETLNLDANGMAVVAGTTVGATDDSRGSCVNPTATTGPDLVYKLVLPATRDVTVNLLPGAGFTSLLYLQQACGVPATEVGCMAPSSVLEARVYRRLPAGTYYVFVDGASSSSSGTFVLDVSAVAPQPSPVNDLCVGATDLGFLGSTTPETVTLSAVDTFYATDDYAGSCAPSDGPDIVYSFTTSSARSFLATVSPNASPMYKPVVYLRSACGTNYALSELTCGQTTTGGAAVSIAVPQLPAGTYYLIVDGNLVDSPDLPGKFDLTATLDLPVASAPANDSCPNAQAIALGAVGTTTTVSGTTVGAGNDTYGDRNSPITGTITAPDVVYSFNLTSASKITATVTPAAGYWPTVILHGASCGGIGYTNEIGCTAATSAGATAQVVAASLHPGTYYLWVDGYGTASTNAGTFSLAVKIEAPTSTPPANDTCAGFQVLSLGVTYNGDATGANNDYDWGYSLAPGCEKPPFNLGTAGQGREVVFAYTPTADGLFKAKFTAGSTSIAIWAGTGTCGDPRTCVGGAGNSNALIINGVAGTTYYLYAEPQTSTGTINVYTMLISKP